MEQKFFKKLTVVEMLALDWDQITTRSWGPEGIPADGHDEVSRGLFRRKAHIPTINLGGTPERAIWFFGTNPEITAYCSRNREVIIHGGNTSHAQLSVLVKPGPANNFIVQIRAQMPADNSKILPGGIGIGRIKDGSNLEAIKPCILLAQRPFLFG